MRQGIKKLINRFTSKPIVNYFDKTFEKTVLIIYITEPFRSGPNPFHSNTSEVISIANIFSDFEYNVDIYDFNYQGKVNFQKYDIIFGIGDLFEESLKTKSANKLYIYYATGAYFEFQNSSEMKRIIELFRRTGSLLTPKRFIPNSRYLSTQLSDAIIILGNDWTISTYIHSKMPFYKVPVSVINSERLLTNRRIDSSRKKYLWLGSYGAVHKGLDLCIETFKNLPDLELNIFGNFEKDFFEIYREELSLNNIRYHGFIDIRSEKFKRIVNQCLFSIFPTCSEGQSGSLLTTMGMGLIPISTKYSGVNLEEKGFEIEGTVESVKIAINTTLAYNESALEKLSRNNFDYVHKNHSLQSFEHHFKENIKNILKKNGGKD